ncbi:MAG: hypothetical protein N4A50_00095 [Vallitalea sp.]|jgi:ABC-type protease/lipase transport system fused ATPase/permease subunit|nr:hypothetical protein [Vallitalea sp.]
MKNKRLSTLTNILFYISIVISVLALGKTYYDRITLPDGVCPVNDNNTLIIVALCSVIIYFIVSIIDWYINKNK